MLDDSYDKRSADQQLRKSFKMQYSRPKVSVIIPTYNAQEFIRETFENVASQTLNDIEIIFIDDCSSDDTLRVLTQLQKADHRVKIFQTRSNSGPSKARNLGFANARGAWVAILDADDRYDYRRLELLVEAAERNSLDMIADNVILVDPSTLEVIGNGLEASPTLLPLSFDDMLKNDGGGRRFHYGWLKPVFRRSFLRKHSLAYREEIRYGEDFLFYCECLLNGARARLSTLPLYFYTLRRSDDQNINSARSRTVVKLDDLINAAYLIKTTYRASMPATSQNLLESRITGLKRRIIIDNLKHYLYDRQLGRAIFYLVSNPGSVVELGRYYAERRKTMKVQRP